MDESAGEEANGEEVAGYEVNGPLARGDDRTAEKAGPKMGDDRGGGVMGIWFRAMSLQNHPPAVSAIYENRVLYSSLERGSSRVSHLFGAAARTRGPALRSTPLPNQRK